MDSLLFASAGEIAAAIRSKQVSALEVVDVHLARIAQVNPALNAVVTLCAERARDEARALMRGSREAKRLAVAWRAYHA